MRIWTPELDCASGCDSKFKLDAAVLVYFAKTLLASIAALLDRLCTTANKRHGVNGSDMSAQPVEARS
jgi:hypothetical protein